MLVSYSYLIQILNLYYIERLCHVMWLGSLVLTLFRCVGFPTS